MEPLAIHTVLGPNIASDDSRRLRGLLEYAVGETLRDAAQVPLAGYPGHTFAVKQQSIWTEDSLSVIERRSLLAGTGANLE